MNGQLLVFTLDEQRYALRLASVARVTRAVAITPLPKAPDIVLGIVNVQGEIVPVINIRKRFRLPEREIALSDQLILACTVRREVILVADAVTGVIESPEGKIIAGDRILPNIDYVAGVMKLDDGVVLIHDLDRFLSLEEEQTLDVALENPTVCDG
ncbi:MAG: chemotaxis protein CheW [Chloroflexi bacterium]|nr:chemotaxis protein CheW [Chloroflexota bacterium]